MVYGTSDGILLGSLYLKVIPGSLDINYVQGTYKQVVGGMVKVATIIGKAKIKRITHTVYIQGTNADTDAATLEGYYDGSELTYNNNVDSFTAIILDLKKTVQHPDYYEYSLIVEEVVQ